LSAIVCGQCGTTSTGRRDGTPWCERCRIWLFACPETGQWVSAAECEFRRRERRRAAVVEHTRRTTECSLDHARRILPPGWHAQVEQTLPGACHTLHLHPPAGAVDAYAYLVPPHDGRGWYVRIHNRTRGVDFPLYTAGGAHAAYFDQLDAAIDAAVTAVRIDTCDPDTRTG
jgi:hypothetical protein